MEAKRFEDYLASTIREKELERRQLEGALSALYSMQSAFKQMSKAAVDQNKFKIGQTVTIIPSGVSAVITDMEWFDNEWHYHLREGNAPYPEKSLR